MDSVGINMYFRPHDTIKGYEMIQKWKTPTIPTTKRVLKVLKESGAKTECLR